MIRYIYFNYSSQTVRTMTSIEHKHEDFIDTWYRDSYNDSYETLMTKHNIGCLQEFLKYENGWVNQFTQPYLRQIYTIFTSLEITQFS